MQCAQQAQNLHLQEEIHKKGRLNRISFTHVRYTTRNRVPGHAFYRVLMVDLQAIETLHNLLKDIIMIPFCRNQPVP